MGLGLSLISCLGSLCLEVHCYPPECTPRACLSKRTTCLIHLQAPPHVVLSQRKCISILQHFCIIPAQHPHRICLSWANNSKLVTSGAPILPICLVRGPSLQKDPGDTTPQTWHAVLHNLFTFRNPPLRVDFIRFISIINMIMCMQFCVSRMRYYHATGIIIITKQGIGTLHVEMTAFLLRGVDINWKMK